MATGVEDRPVREAGAASSAGQLFRAGVKPPLLEHTLPDRLPDRLTVADLTKPKPKTKITAAPARESLALSQHLRINMREALSFDDEKRVATVIIMTDGKGNNDDNHYYFPDTVKQAVLDKVFDGVQAYADHPTLEEDVIRPERSTRDLIGYYYDSQLANVVDINGKPRVAYQAKMQILEGSHFDWVVSLIKESIRHKQLFPNKPPLVGISINADGKFAPGTNPEDGTNTNGVTKVTKAFSADMVTKPARGGVFLNLKESQRGSRTSQNTEEQNVNDKLREAATRIKDQMTRGEIDTEDVTVLIEATLKEAATPGKKNADGTDAEDKADGGADDSTELEEAGGKEADANMSEADKTKRALEAKRDANMTVEDLRKKYPTMYDAALKEAQRGQSDKIAELQTKLAEVTAANQLRESAESARTKLREAGLPTSAAARLMHTLIGKTDEEQTQLIESEVAFLKEIGFNADGGERVKGAGEGKVALREANSESRSNEAKLFAGV